MAVVIGVLSTGNRVEPVWVTLFTTIGSSMVGFTSTSMRISMVGFTRVKFYLCHLDFFTVTSMTLGCRNLYEDQPYCNHVETILPPEPKNFGFPVARCDGQMACGQGEL